MAYNDPSHREDAVMGGDDQQALSGGDASASMSGDDHRALRDGDAPANMGDGIKSDGYSATTSGAINGASNGDYPLEDDCLPDSDEISASQYETPNAIVPRQDDQEAQAPAPARRSFNFNDSSQLLPWNVDNENPEPDESSIQVR
jgi:hypothetical protein